MLNARQIVCKASMLMVLFSSNSVVAMTDQEQCMLQEMQHADEQVTVLQIRELCQSIDVADSSNAVAGKTGVDSNITQQSEQPLNAVDVALDEREALELKPFSLIAHKPNYFLAAVYNSSGYGEEPYQEQFNDQAIESDDTEAQFQISIKTPLAIDLFDKNIDIYAAYTNRSFWQVYNEDNSSPFRDTNHEPEVWLQWRPDQVELLGFKNSANLFGFVHQSNGRGGDLSRSWNRLFANFIFSNEAFALSFKPWWRIPEDSDDDDNPDITDYLGHFQWGGAYKLDGHTFSAMMRNNFESGFSRGTTELSWSFPIPHYDYFNGYVQFFNGYGQSLIDYDRHVNSIGIGISLSDWL